MKIIALANWKGGTARTTTAVNVSYGLGELGRKTLLIDLDPQAHATYSLGIQAGDFERTVYDVLHGDATIQEAIIQRGKLSLVPSTLDLSAADLEFSGVPSRESILKDSIKGLRGFDYCFIDCPPSLGLLTLNAFAVAKEIYIPIQTEALALRGIAKLTDTIDLVKKRLNPRLEISGVLATRYDSRKVLNRLVLEELESYFEDIVFKTKIRENIALAEAPLKGLSIFEYAPRSHGAEDYLALVKEIMGRK